MLKSSLIRAALKGAGYASIYALQIILAFMICTFITVRVNGYFVPQHLAAIALAVGGLQLIWLLLFLILYKRKSKLPDLAGKILPGISFSGLLFQGLVISLFALMFLGVEHWLEERKIYPGMDPYWDGFHKVDSLYMTHEFDADSLGIMRANSGYYTWNTNPAFKYIQVDTNGFRNDGSYSVKDTTRKKILLLGDSFTWGFSAAPITNSFPDLLRKMGFSVYNTGIPGTGLVQYELVYNTLGPVLKPDIVCINFCLDNDCMDFERTPAPFLSDFFFTNAGAFSTERPHLSAEECKYAYFKTAREAYDYDLQAHSILNDRRLLLRYLSQTTIGTIIYYTLRNFFNKPHQEVHCTNSYNPRITRNHLLSIIHEAKMLHAATVIAAIPSKQGVITTREQLLTSFPGIFDSLDVVICPDLTRADFSEGIDAHFNNSGHRKYAECLAKKFREIQ